MTGLTGPPGPPGPPGPITPLVSALTSIPAATIAEGGIGSFEPANVGTYYGDTSGQARTSGTDAVVVPNVFAVRAADWVIANRTPKLRVTCICLVNDTGPGVTLVVGPSSVTVAGGSGLQTVTCSAHIGGTIAFVSPAANSKTYSVGGRLALPADGVYAVTCIPAGAAAAASVVTLRYRVEVVFD